MIIGSRAPRGCLAGLKYWDANPENSF